MPAYSRCGAGIRGRFFFFVFPRVFGARFFIVFDAQGKINDVEQFQRDAEDKQQPRVCERHRYKNRRRYGKDQCRYDDDRKIGFSPDAVVNEQHDAGNGNGVDERKPHSFEVGNGEQREHEHRRSDQPHQ